MENEYKILNKWHKPDSKVARQNGFKEEKERGKEVYTRYHLTQTFHSSCLALASVRVQTRTKKLRFNQRVSSLPS